jgi:hypothetical protein
MFSLQQGNSFQNVPLPHQDPFGWLSGKYDSINPGNPQCLSNPPSRFERETLHAVKQICDASADENGFVMSYEDANNLVKETYPGYLEVNESCQITDWQAAKHIYHSNGMGINPVDYGFTQQDLVFTKCTFEKFHFYSTVFSHCKFQECTFLESDFNAANIYQCNFQNSTFIKSDFFESDISETSFYSCQFQETSFAKAYFENCNFQDTHFQNSYSKGLCPILDNSKISMDDWSIKFNGGFDFDEVLKFVNSIKS